VRNLQSLTSLTGIVFGLVLLGFALFVRKQDEGWFQRLFERDTSARMVGICCVAFGGLLSWMLVVVPLSEALTMKRSVAIARGAVVLPSIFIFIGMICLVAGSRSTKLILTRHGQSPTKLQKITTGVGVTICLLGEIGFHYLLVALGHTSKW